MNGQILPKQPRGHIFEIQVFHIALPVKDIVFGKMSESAMQTMNNDGIRNIDAVESCQAGPKIQVPVLIDTKEVFIQQSDLSTNHPPIKHPPSAATNNSLQFGQMAV